MGITGVDRCYDGTISCVGTVSCVSITGVDLSYDGTICLVSVTGVDLCYDGTVFYVGNVFVDQLFMRIIQSLCINSLVRSWPGSIQHVSIVSVDQACVSGIVTGTGCIFIIQQCAGCISVDQCCVGSICSVPEAGDGVIIHVGFINVVMRRSQI